MQLSRLPDNDLHMDQQLIELFVTHRRFESFADEHVGSDRIFAGVCAPGAQSVYALPIFAYDGCLFRHGKGLCNKGLYSVLLPSPD